MKRITLSDIAQAAGVSRMTVSLSLRNHRSIPEKTKKRIRAIANKMGYRPDPVLSALNTYRHANHQVHYQATFAWINSYPNRYFLRSIYEFDCYFRGAERRANELGYTIEEFWLHEPGLTMSRLEKILTNRRVQGLILAPAPYNYKVEFPWEKFCTVALGFSHPLYHHIVMNAQYRSMRLAIKNLCDLGYQRVASYANWDFSERTDWNFMSGYMAEIVRQGRKPIYLQLRENQNCDRDPSILKKWYLKNKPDAIITADHFIFGVLDELKVEVGKDIGMALLARNSNDPTMAYIDQNSLRIGSAAVDQLVGLVQRNECGLSESPMRVLIDGSWVNGISAPGIKS